MSIKTSVTLAEMMKAHLHDTVVLKERMSDFEELKDNGKRVKHRVLKSELDVNLSTSSWNRVLNEPILSSVFKRYQTKGDHIDIIIKYPFASQLQDEEWEALLTNEKGLAYLEAHASTHRDKSVYLPLIVEYLMNKRDFDTFVVIKNQISSSLVTSYGAVNISDVLNHQLFRAMFYFVCETGVPFETIHKIVTKLNLSSEEVLSYVNHLTKLLISVQENMLVQDKKTFIEGYQKLMSIVSRETIDEMAKKRGIKFGKDLSFIAGRIKTTIPEKVFNRLLHKEKESIEEVLFGTHQEWMEQKMAEYRNKCLETHDTTIKDNERAKIALLQRAAMDNKKAFIKLYKEFEETEVLAKGALQALSHPLFYKLVNVNTLNKDTIKRAVLLHCVKRNFEDIEGPITFQEFEFLHDSTDVLRKLYARMNDWKVDEKIRVLSSLPKITWHPNYFLSIDAFLARLSESMKEKDFRHYTKYMKEKGVNKQNALFLKVLPERFESVWNQIESDVDVELIMKYELQPNETIIEMKTRLYDNLPEMKEFIEFLEVGEVFVKNNRNRLYQFYEKGLMNIVMTYRKGVETGKENNLRLLAKAEIAGKLKEIKFRDEDFKKELGITTKEYQRELWRKDIVKNEGKRSFYETSDFYHLINMGEIPTSTCQSWKTGSYRECLLSVFDLNKKMIVVEKDGKVIGRALLRLTKTTSSVKKEKKSLEFIDVESLNEQETSQANTEENEKRLVLFLERLYTSHTGHEVTLMKEHIVSIALEKAKEMDTELLLAMSYNVKNVEKETVEIPVYISHSKNGRQYLDSLGGSASDEKGGKYHQASVYKVTI